MNQLKTNQITSLAFLLAVLFAHSHQAHTQSDTLNLLFVGDIMGHSPQIKSAYDAATQTYDYTPCFKYVKPIIEAADLAIGNLEVTLPGQPPYTGYPMFRSPDELATATKYAGFDMLVTSNNHSNDGGIKGINHTIDVLNQLNLYHTGTFKNEEMRKALYPLIVYKKGFKLAFLNYTYDTNGLPTPSPAVVNEIDENQIQKDIKAAQALKPDGIIVVMHWGLEYQLNESPKQQALTDKIFAWGADLVIGAHPHVVQPIKERFAVQPDGALKKQVVVYSMGNFISNQQKTNTDGGIMFEIRLIKETKAGKSELSLGEHSYIPVWRYIERKQGKKTYYALPISAVEDATDNPLELSANNMKLMKNFGAKTRKHLEKYDGKERKIKWKTIDEAIQLGTLGSNLTPSSPLNVSPSRRGRDAQSVGFQERKMPFAYAVGDKMGSYETATRGGAASASLAYFVSIPVHRVDTSIKGNIEKIAKYQPNNNTPSSNGNTPKSGEAMPKTLFQPKNNGIKSGNEQGTVIPAAKPEPYTSIETPQPTRPKAQTPAQPSQQPKQPQPSTGRYTIQFQAARSLYPKSSFPFGNVQIEATPKGWYRYYAGSAETLAEAKALLQQIQAAGYPDAFITKKKNIQDVENTPKGMGASPAPSSASIVYKVRFQSAQNYYEIDPKLFADVLVIENDGWFRYYTGSATNISDANELLKRVQARGFKDAFVVTFENGKPK